MTKSVFLLVILLYRTTDLIQLALCICFTVLSSSLKWVPIGNQTDIFQETNMQPLHDDILLAKMNSGHEINLEAYAVKGRFVQVAFQAN